jgi:hypothetical protein
MLQRSCRGLLYLPSAIRQRSRLVQSSAVDSSEENPSSNEYQPIFDSSTKSGVLKESERADLETAERGAAKEMNRRQQRLAFDEQRRISDKDH